MKKSIVFFISAIIIVFSACKKGEEAGEVINPQDIGFVYSATVANAGEIALGQLAADSSQTPAIQAYGQKMVAEHSAAQAQLEALASSLGIATPDTLSQRHIQLMNELKLRKDRSFDSLYIHNQVYDHQISINLYQTAHGFTHNSQVKDLLRNTLPMVLQHEQEAVALAAGY